MIKRPYLYIFVILLALVFAFRGLSTSIRQPAPSPKPAPLWSIRSIDTMKFSRDIAREKLNDQSYDVAIDKQLKNIAATGASHVAIATPYDEEFVPYLTRWVTIARHYHLKIWFRGNFSGWEQWFDHAKITRAEHLSLTAKFITSHSNLFEDGDIFTACPECENGGPGDPRMTGDVVGYRQFLIDSTNAAGQAFVHIGKNVTVGYNSMNYDVAMAVMDPPTTRAVGGVVVIDHYVKTPEQVISDIKKLQDFSGGKVFLGEFGAPIPDLHGDMTQAEQSAWLSKLLDLLVANNSVIGLNYWVAVGGSTQLWDNDGVARSAVSVLTSFYTRKVQK